MKISPILLKAEHGSGSGLLDPKSEKCCPIKR
jgi:hypothetical protein